MSGELWIIEARNPDGSLDLRTLQANHIFGMKAITGISEEEMAKTVYRYDPLTPSLSGRDVPNWPTRLHPKWIARRKTW